jgi:hypothetical protein
MKTPAVRDVPKLLRIASAVAGPVVLTVGYFTVPLHFLGRGHQVLSWALLGGLLVAMAVGMTLLTGRALTDAPGHPGAGILILSWASLLLFAASYWVLATLPGQFSGLKTRIDALYFTVITLATVGYGDIVPTGQLSRGVVMVQLLYSFAFLAAGLTAMTSRRRKRLMDRAGA